MSAEVSDKFVGNYKTINTQRSRLKTREIEGICRIGKNIIGGSSTGTC